MPAKQIYSSREIQLKKTTSVKRKRDMWNYFYELSFLTNNLYNRIMFIQRNHYTATQKVKEGVSLTSNEQGIWELVQKYDIKSSPSGYISKFEIEKLLRASKDADYYALPGHVNTYVIWQVDAAFKGFFAASKDYKAHPEKYNGRPRLPGYLQKGGQNVISFDYCCCVIKTNKKGNYYLRFPKTDLIINLGKKPLPGKFKQVKVVFDGILAKVFVITQGDYEVPEKPVTPKRVVAVDPGVKWFMAVTNNFGAPNLLFSSHTMIESIETCDTRITVLVRAQNAGKKDQSPISSPLYQSIWRKRNNYIKDTYHKFARILINFCLANNVDTLVFGHNKYWKQESNLGKELNRIFQQLPISEVMHTLKYLCERYGITYIEHEESYTSKASFLDNDPIPVYDPDAEVKPKFSGRRLNRDVYQASDGTRIHADLNGAANILRKAVPDAFTVGEMPHFKDIIRVVSPDQNYNYSDLEGRILDQLPW